MSGNSWHDTCATDICSLEEENPTSVSIFTRLADGEGIAVRFLADINYADIDLASSTNWETTGDICSRAICEDDIEDGGADADQFRFGDGDWAGRPQDIARPNTHYEGRLRDPATISKRIPIVPEVGRRAQTQFGDVRVNNADGELDTVGEMRTIDGRTMRIYVGPARGDFIDFSQILEAIGDKISGDTEQLFFSLKNVTQLLDKPLQTQIYEGTGGIAGDENLAGRKKPTCFGECFNITPVLKNNDELIYQFHTGEAQSIDYVKDSGLRLTWSGQEVSDFTSLRALSVPAGQWASAKAIGMFKLGSTPAGIVTADVKGEVGALGYTDETGEILQRLALGAAFLSVSEVDFAGFNELPTDAIGYYDSGENNTLVSDVFDQLLRPVNGWYGQLNTARLSVGMLQVTNADNQEFHLTDDDIIDIREEPTDATPRYKQSMTYAKNWTPMTSDQIAGGVPADQAERLRESYKIKTEIDAAVLQRFPSAIEGEQINSFFVNEEGAADAVRNQLMAVLKLPLRQVVVKTKLQGLIINFNEVALLSSYRFGMNETPGTVISTSWDLARNEVELGMLV